MRNPKAQIKMFETIAVLVIFFVILIIGLVYYNGTQKREIREMQDEDRVLRAIEIMKITTYLPELQCSMDNVLTANCIDLAKLENFMYVSDQERLYYTSIFGFGKISVREIYPEEKEYILYFNNKSSTRDIISSPVPILIYDSISRKYYAGVMLVELYQ
jgi:hypothetical protein